MREILFRGKRVDNGKWIEGYLFQIWDDAFILWGTTNDVPNMIKVDLATVGQYTGLKDKNGNRIFEGDIIQIPDDYHTYGEFVGEKYEIIFAYGGFRFKPKNPKSRGIWFEEDMTYDVVGNIYDKEATNGNQTD